MTWELIVTLFCACLASPLLVKLVEILPNKLRKNKKETQLDRIEHDTNLIKSDINSMKMDQLRTNLLLLITDYPNKSDDIPNLAKLYIERGGNSFIIPLVVDWYRSKGLDFPEWLKEANDKHCNYSLDKE